MLSKQELVNFSNKRSYESRFINYEDYVDYQVVKGLSFEKDNAHWANGQRRCVEKKFSNVNRKFHILDVCCGDGVGLKQFKDMGFVNVTGVEISDEKIAFAKQINPNVIKRDICSGPFDLGGPYDIIYSSHTIEHVLNPEYTIKNIMSFLKDEGTFFLILPYPDSVAADPRYADRFKVHCGVIPLGLHINDGGQTTKNIINNLGFTVSNVEFDSFREPEIHLTIHK